MTSLKRLRALSIAAALGGVCLFAGAPAFAQAVQCDASGTDEERIACLQARVDALEAELARARGELAAATPGEDAPVAAVEDPTASFGAEQLEQAAPVATAAAEPARRGRRWLRMPRVNIPFLGRDDDESGSEETAVAATEPAATGPAATGPASAAITGPESFGSEQVATRNNDADETRQENEEVLRARIVDFQELHRGRLVVALDNGQMWRQMDVDTRQIRLREGETYPVEIRRSGFGGYRMKVADNNRIMTVERLR